MRIERNYKGYHVLTYDKVDGKIEIVITKGSGERTGTFVQLSRWGAFMTGLGLMWTAIALPWLKAADRPPQSDMSLTDCDPPAFNISAVSGKPT